MTTAYDDEDYDPMRLPEVKDKMFVLVGPTRSGKSTFINTLIGSTVAEEGKANTIISTTKEVQNYRDLRVVHAEEELFPGQKEAKLNFMDTIGFGDTAVDFTDEEI